MHSPQGKFSTLAKKSFMPLFSFTPTLDDSSVSQSQLAFYGTYNTGNILSVKNVYLTLGEYHTNQESINNYTTTNGQTINLYAVWK